MSEINNNMTKQNVNAPIKAALGSKDDSVEKKWNSVMWRNFTFAKRIISRWKRTTNPCAP